MKIGIFGGSFDPIHLGHLLLAETAREAGGLEQVWFNPAFQSPLKTHEPRATPRQRLEMLRLAVAGYPAFRVYDGEIKRKGVSYTVETLRSVAAENPDAELFLIIGADSLAEFPRWHDPLGILELAQVMAMNRSESTASLDPVQAALGAKVLPRFHLVQMPMIGLSSTALRERVAAGNSIRFQTPRAIEQYIHQHRLYASEA